MAWRRVAGLLYWTVKNKQSLSVVALMKECAAGQMLEKDAPRPDADPDMSQCRPQALGFNATAIAAMVVAQSGDSIANLHPNGRKSPCGYALRDSPKRYRYSYSTVL